MLDRAIPCAQAGGIAIKLFAAGKTVKNIADNRCICVEFSNVPAYILVRRIPQELQLCLICPQDDPRGADDVQPDGAVLEEVLQVLALAVNLRLDPLLLRNILKAIDRP